MNIPEVTLEETCDFLSGFAWSAPKFNTASLGIPIIRIQNVDSDRDKDFIHWNEPYEERFVVEKDDLLLSLSGSFRVGLWDGPSALLNQRIVKLIPKKNVTHEWLLHVLRHRIGKISNLGRHALVSNVALADLRKFSVPLPSVHEQRRIAAILDQADALKAKRWEALAQLDSLTQSLFIEMFGDPSANVKRWPTKRLSDLVIRGDTINYGVIQPGDDVDEGIPLVRVGDLIDGRVRHDSLKKITPEIESAYKRSRLHGDEILVSCVGTIGVVVLANKAEKGFNIARAVARIRLSPGTSREFLAAQLQTESVQRYFIKESRTVSQPTLNIKQLSETAVIWPPVSLQTEFSNRIAALEKLKLSAHGARIELDNFFASLQHRAFRGEL